MTVLERVTSMNALHQLRTNPLAFLTANTLTVQNLAGVDTALQTLAFGCANHRAALSDPVMVLAACGGPAHADCVLAGVQVHATPMRLRTAGAGRTAQTARIAAGAGPGLWVTTRQTGCSVLVLDWGAAFSMVHLQPSNAADFGWSAVRRVMANSFYADREIVRYSLQWELSQVVAATRGAGPAPLRYILVQSGWTRHAGSFLGVTGVRDNAGQWSFHVQEYTGAGVVNARLLPWTTWNHRGPYRPQAY